MAYPWCHLDCDPLNGCPFVLDAIGDIGMYVRDRSRRQCLFILHFVLRNPDTCLETVLILYISTLQGDAGLLYLLPLMPWLLRLSIWVKNHVSNSLIKFRSFKQMRFRKNRSGKETAKENKNVTSICHLHTEDRNPYSKDCWSVEYLKVHCIVTEDMQKVQTLDLFIMPSLQNRSKNTYTARIFF